MRIRWLVRLLLPRLLRLAESRAPDFAVTRDGGERVYLRRWWLIPRNSLFNLYLHCVLLDDDQILHDHPYFSLSLVLTDGLEENWLSADELQDQRDGLAESETPHRRTLREGQLVWRSSTFAHQLVVNKEAWTLFLTGPRVREWGFWCPRGWRPWHQYVATSQDPSVRGSGVAGTGTGISTRGVGCGEP